jgi:hypothetical protein
MTSTQHGCSNTQRRIVEYSWRELWHGLKGWQPLIEVKCHPLRTRVRSKNYGLCRLGDHIFICKRYTWFPKDEVEANQRQASQSWRYRNTNTRRIVVLPILLLSVTHGRSIHDVMCFMAWGKSIEPNKCRIQAMHYKTNVYWSTMSEQSTNMCLNHVCGKHVRCDFPMPLDEPLSQGRPSLLIFNL